MLKYFVGAAIVVAAWFATAWGLEARIFGPRVPAEIADNLQAPPIKTALSFQAANGDEQNLQAFAGRWVVVCDVRVSCSRESQLPMTSLVAALGRLDFSHPVTSPITVLAAMRSDEFRPDAQVGAVDVRAVFLRGASEFDAGRILVIDPAGRLYATIDPAVGPGAFAEKMSKIVRFLDREMLARLL